MAITPEVLQNLAKMADLHIETLNHPTWGGEPQVFQVRPSELLLTAAGDLIPTETVLSAAIPVKIEVTWGVEDIEGNPLGSDQAITHAGVGQKALQVAVMVLPDFVELRREQTLVTKTRYVTAKAKLTVTTIDPISGAQRIVSAEVPLLRHPITVPAIPVPTAAIFFRGDDLGVVDGERGPEPQFVLIAVPADSAIAGISALRDACETLQRLTGTASDLLKAASFVGVGLPSLKKLGAGLDTLITALNVHRIQSDCGVAFLPGDSVRNLNNTDVIKHSFFRNNIEAEDEISSLVLLGPPGRRLSVYRHRDFKGRGADIISSDSCITIVPNLRSVPPPTDPEEHSTQVGGPPILNAKISSIAFR
jgi:hypothetical protein